MRRLARELGVRYALRGLAAAGGRPGPRYRAAARCRQRRPSLGRPLGPSVGRRVRHPERGRRGRGGPARRLQRYHRHRRLRTSPNASGRRISAPTSSIWWAWPISTWARGRASRRPSRSFERSIAIEPTLARAWTGLARSYLQLRDQVEDGRDPLRRAIEAARRAVALDARDAEAAAALAFALGEQGDLAESEAMFDRALALNPSSAEILTSYASWASTFGKPEAGVEAAQRALRLNPNMPPAALAKNRYAFFMTGRYDEALRLNARIPREAYGRDDFIYRAVLAQRDRQRRGCPGRGRGGAGAFPVDLGRGLVRPGRLQRCRSGSAGWRRCARRAFPSAPATRRWSSGRWCGG